MTTAGKEEEPLGAADDAGVLWPPRHGAPEPERQCLRHPDGCAKGAGGGGSSSSLPVSTLTLSGAPPLLCGEFLGWVEAAASSGGSPGR
uniref:Uncharacterized protein n=1 Tax=Oryza brachyantha TaxID=4533 RepID=J3L8G9_ORYBR